MGPCRGRVFFTLSGFILTWTNDPRLRRRYFYGPRLASVYPLRIVTAAAAVILAVLAGPSVDVLPAILNVWRLQAWVPVESYGESLNGVNWSLCCEALFYLLFPFLLRWARRWAMDMVIFIITAASVTVDVVNGELAVRKVTELTLTFDHSVCDGGTADGFLLLRCRRDREPWLGAGGPLSEFFRLTQCAEIAGPLNPKPDCPAAV